MQNFKRNFYVQVEHRPNEVALRTRHQQINYRELADEISRISGFLKNRNVNCIALAMSNSAAWVTFDLAALFSNVVTVPVPHFFTPSQLQHLISDAGIDLVITDSYLNNTVITSGHSTTQCVDVFAEPIFIHPIVAAQATREFPNDTLKISYTSGTTGNAKGVLISGQQADKVVGSLMTRLAADENDRHLNTLPFSLLLENIAGIYTVLASGGQCMIPDPAELGLSGSSSLDPQRFINTIKNYQPTTLITVPAFAQALVNTSQRLKLTHDSLRFVAVGGAPMSDSIITAAHRIGLPMYEGYGLTECSSVAALNTPDQHKPGSVGKPLPHVEIDISEQGEILIRGALSHGYLDQAVNNNEIWATGDLGYIDEDGFLFITGRKRTAYSTAFGRNVAPEWIERELITQPVIEQVIVYGEGKPFNLAIIVPAQNASCADVDNAITTVNQSLPDYARISIWFKADEPYSIKNKQLSTSGIMQRRRILKDYQSQIEHIYQ